MSTTKAALRAARPQRQQWTPDYRAPRLLSSPIKEKISETLKPGQSVRRWDAGLDDALCLLLLGLQRDDLSPGQRVRGWAIVRRWLPQFVVARLARGAA